MRLTANEMDFVMKPVLVKRVWHKWIPALQQRRTDYPHQSIADENNRMKTTGRPR